jgi:hypothetical protein
VPPGEAAELLRRRGPVVQARIAPRTGHHPAENELEQRNDRVGGGGGDEERGGFEDGQLAVAGREHADVNTDDRGHDHDRREQRAEIGPAPIQQDRAANDHEQRQQAQRAHVFVRRPWRNRGFGGRAHCSTPKMRSIFS